MAILGDGSPEFLICGSLKILQYGSISHESKKSLHQWKIEVLSGSSPGIPSEESAHRGRSTKVTTHWGSGPWAQFSILRSVDYQDISKAP